MRRVIPFLAAALLTGCASTKEPEYLGPAAQQAAEIIAANEPPKEPECAPKVRAIVRKYMPVALSYPPNSAHRNSYFMMIDAEYRALMIGQSPLQHGLCNIDLKYAVQKVLLKAEEARGIK